MTHLPPAGMSIDDRVAFARNLDARLLLIEEALIELKSSSSNIQEVCVDLAERLSNLEDRVRGVS